MTKFGNEVKSWSGKIFQHFALKAKCKAKNKFQIIKPQE